MKVRVKIEQEVEVKTINFFCKVRDEGTYTLKGDGGIKIKEHDGYVPEFFPNHLDGSPHYGDYVELEIDIETGKILNWKKPTDEQLNQFVNKED